MSANKMSGYKIWRSTDMQLYTTVRHAIVSGCILHVNNVLTKHYIDSCINSSGLITSCKEMTVSVMTLVSVVTDYIQADCDSIVTDKDGKLLLCTCLSLLLYTHRHMQYVLQIMFTNTHLQQLSFIILANHCRPLHSWLHLTRHRTIGLPQAALL